MIKNKNKINVIYFGFINLKEKIHSVLSKSHSLYFYTKLFLLFMLKKCRTEFNSVAELIEYYTEILDELPCLLSSARVNHCYEWEENPSKQPSVKLHKTPSKTKTKSTSRKRWFWTLDTGTSWTANLWGCEISSTSTFLLHILYFFVFLHMVWFHGDASQTLIHITTVLAHNVTVTSRPC